MRRPNSALPWHKREWMRLPQNWRMALLRSLLNNLAFEFEEGDTAKAKPTNLVDADAPPSEEWQFDRILRRYDGRDHTCGNPPSSAKQVSHNQATNNLYRTKSSA